jgi:cytochrome c2
LARWKRTSALALGLLLALSASGEEPALAFRSYGKPVATRGIAALEKAAAAQSVRVFEPYEQREIPMRALPFDRVLDAVYGNAWRSAEELLFTCLDGYQPTVPVARVLEHHAFLAFARDDAPKFTLRKLESGRWQEIPAGPFYLVWENLSDTQVRREGDYAWPYQLTGVELIRARDHFPHMAPPADASPTVQQGFAAFRIHCSRCHTVNGDGGKIGPELNRVEAPAGRRDAKWLHDWIDDPSRLSPGTRMERLNPALANREPVIASIIAYLQAMVGKHD